MDADPAGPGRHSAVVTTGVRDSGSRGLKFEQLAGELRRGILAGEWAPGAKLPTEAHLTGETGLSLTTVRRAYDTLVDEGLITRRQGAGSFVSSLRRRDPRIRYTVGVLVPDTRLYYPRVLQGIEEGLSAAGAGLQLATYHYDPEEEQQDLEFLLDSGIDGLLLVPTLIGVPDPVARVDELMSLPVPAVLLERRLLEAGPDDRAEYVCSDHIAGAYDAVRHLHGLGHSSVALVTRSHNPTVAAVSRGYLQAVEDLGLAPTTTLSATKDQWTPERADNFVAELANAGVRAALVFGDREAIMICSAARRRGLDVPGELALVSYDDETADLAEIPLTAVAPPKYRVGRMAAEILLRRLNEGDACPLHQIKLRPRIVVRASCGARLSPARQSR